VSSICYYRGLFPPQFFKTKSYGQVQIQQLQGAEKGADGRYQTDSEEACLVTNWLERGVFKALENQYVSSMIFAIYASDPLRDGGRLLETYEFKVAYQSGSSSAKINDVEMYSKESVKAQAAKFIRSLMEFASTLDPLPQDRWIQLQLTYTDKAPADYEPEYFGPAAHSILQGRTFPLKVRIGTLKTKDMDLSVQFAGLENLLFQDFIKDMNLNEKTVFQGAIHPAPEVPRPTAVPLDDLSAAALPVPAKVVAEEETKVSADDTMQDDTSAMKASPNPRLLGDDYHSPSEVYVLVRHHVLENKRPVISKCAKDLNMGTEDVKAAFQSLVEDGLLKKHAHKYQLTGKQPAAGKEPASHADGDTTDADENEHHMNVEVEKPIQTPINSKNSTKDVAPQAPNAANKMPSKVPGILPLSQVSDAESARHRKFSTLKEPLHLHENKKARTF